MNPLVPTVMSTRSFTETKIVKCKVSTGGGSLGHFKILLNLLNEKTK